MIPSKSGPIHLCAFCGEKCKSTYCSFCKTKEKRKELTIQQIKIDEENAKKGYNISETLFGFPRQQLIEKLR